MSGEHSHGDEAVFQGRWYAYPPLRNALIAGIIAAVAFALARTGVIGRDPAAPPALRAAA